MAFAGLLALGVVVLIGVLLVRIRSDAERDVDAMLYSSVRTQLTQSSEHEASVVQHELDGVLSAVKNLADDAEQAYLHPTNPSAAETARYVDGPHGTYLTSDTDGVSMFYSGLVPVGAAQKAKAAQLSVLDPTLRAIVTTSSLAVQSYINTNDGMTRIYPGFDVLTAFEPGADATAFNFYYLADGTHDPHHDPVWTNVYIDPAGKGWMTSAIAPVWVDGRLEAVVGVDVTVSRLVGDLLIRPQPFDSFSMLVDSEGVVVAMPPAGEAMLQLRELTDAHYDSFVTTEQFKASQGDFDLDQRADTKDLASALASSPQGSRDIAVNGVTYLGVWNTLEQGWRMLTMVPVAHVQSLHAPGERLKEATAVAFTVVLGGLVAMVLALAWRGRRMSLLYTGPLEAIDDATDRIAAGDFTPDIPPAPVAELDRTAQRLVAMGKSLETAQNRMLADSARLREGEERYRTIFENVAEPVLTVAVDGTVVDANDAADSAFGRVLENTEVGDILDGDDWRRPGRHTVQVDAPNGERRTFELVVGSTGEGDQQRFTLTAHDITATETARRLLEEASATAERTARMKDEFLASMSHEIRTPLNGVIGVLSLLADRPLPPEAHQELAVARRSADDLLVLVNDVLDFAKIEANQVSVVSNDVRLVDVLDGVRRLYEPFAAEQRNELVVRVDPTLPEWVRLDPTRVRQVLMNLVSNALKFTDHGRVVIAVRRDPPATSPSANQAPFDLRFEVQDTGVGIDADVQQRLFTRFTQGDPLATRKYPGTGLGLAIAKRLTELMGGSVGLISAPGEGSTFWFTVRSGAGVAAPDRPAPIVVARDTTRSLKVLVAEDNEVNLYLVVAILERLGHSVVAVGNGREAVEAAQSDTFDLVMMDVQMPVANGIDATRAIRALPGPMSTVPILAVTANVLPEQQALYEQVGFTGWVPKPLTLEHVERAIASVLPESGVAAPMVVEEVVDDTALFDDALIEQYRSVIGDDGSNEMVTLFVATLAERRVELRSAVAAQANDEVRRLGHAVKGMAAAVGAVRLSRTGERMQHASDDDVSAAVQRFEVEADLALADVHAAWRIVAD
jgi:signal transduction histidine kinase/CheY-like chemotaxis protein/HPt (histidine-containing phosphotransfer) domain-containing protein